MTDPTHDVTTDADEIVCPWCGYEHTNSNEFFGDSQVCTTDECSDCGKPIEIRREFSVTYITRTLTAQLARVAVNPEYNTGVVDSAPTPNTTEEPHD
jgi:NAD-dependent dihydropyrimidine dehydrogenase PreA subunit